MEGIAAVRRRARLRSPRRNRPEPPPPLPAERARGGGGRPPRKPRRLRSETLARIAWAIPWIAIVVTIAIVGGELFAAAMIGFACVGISELCPDDAATRARSCSPRSSPPRRLVVAAFYGDQYEMMIVLAASIPLIFVSAVDAARPRRDHPLDRRHRVRDRLDRDPVRARGAAARAARPRCRRCWSTSSSAPSSPTPPPTPAGACSAATGSRPALSPNKTLEGLAFGFVGGTLGLLVRRPLPGLAAGGRRAPHRHVRGRRSRRSATCSSR